ncbi:MAG: choice-of-anchor B family protein [Bacteroidetes bacterium]|nr:choice-of-anchor B family protein [Bacteroidota bacterium]
MKKIILFFTSLLSLHFTAQTYPSQNISLLSLINPNTGTVGVGPDSRRYSGVWGWKQTSKNKEYAISGTSNGTYFIDVTSPTTPSVSAFVQGKLGCTWREMKTFQNYCYIMSDDASPNRFQIVDMQYLPDSVHVIHNGTQYFERAHAMWIDGNKLYCSGVTYSTGVTSSMNVYSLATPTAPLLLRQLNQDANFISYVHDMYVRNDTVFASCGFAGLYIFKFNTGANNFTQLGSYTSYPSSGYNHSSFLTQNGKYLVFCDESPAGLPIHIVDVQNMSNVQNVQTFKPYSGTTSHNPYLMGNNIAVLSCYEDGLYIYNISQPASPCVVGFFDTYPQSGGNVGYSGQSYRGNWGAYPYLPSGIILANDMQNGLFILDPTAAYTNSTCINVGIKASSNSTANFIFYPNPANDRIALNYNTNSSCTVQIKNMLGRLVFEKKYEGMVSDYVDVKQLDNGTYILTVTENSQSITKKLVINH